MPEGTLFYRNEPILRVTAPLPAAQLVETRLINILQYQTLVASKAARMLDRSHFEGSQACRPAIRATYAFPPQY
jgi:nicotinic acid phosphoribosyltransferase